MKKPTELGTRGGAREGAGRKAKEGKRIAMVLSEQSLREIENIGDFLMLKRHINSDELEAHGDDPERPYTRTELIEKSISVAHARIVGSLAMQNAELARLEANRARRDAIARGEDPDA